jgi:hypothetical protein
MQTKEQILSESIETNVEMMCITKRIFSCTTVQLAFRFFAHILQVTIHPPLLPAS